MFEVSEVRKQIAILVEGPARRRRLELDRKQAEERERRLIGLSPEERERILRQEREGRAALGVFFSEVPPQFCR